jgi:uncharacterized protein YciI
MASAVLIRVRMCAVLHGGTPACLQMPAPLTARLASSAAASPASAASPHAYMALEYAYDAKDAEDLAKKRAPLRAAHLAHADKAKAAGLLKMGGAYGDAPMGGLLLFKTADAAVVQAFAREDPYVKGKLVSGFKVRPWTVVVDGLSGQ